MGGGGKGSQTTTQQVSIPPEVLARYNAVNARAESVARQPFQQYGTRPEAFVAPLTREQQQGISQTGAYAQAAQPYFNYASDQLQYAQQQGQQQLGQAYQPLYQGYQTGQQLGAGAQQYFTGAGQAAIPFYQAAAGGLGAGLQYAGGLQGGALEQAFAAPGMAAPLQEYGSEAITGAPGVAALPNMAAMRMGLGAARQAAPYYGAATAGTQAGLQESAPYQGLATQAALAGSQAISPQQFSQQGINQYMSPFLSNVVQQTMAAQAQQNAQQRQALTGEAIKAGAFGGDRAGIAQANLGYQQNLANQQTIANLLQGGYGQALGAFQQQQGVNLAAEQANRQAMQQLAQQSLAIGQQGYGQQLGAAQQMAGLGQALFGQGMQGAQTLAGLGQTQYGQQLGAGQAAAQLGQQLYGQGMTGAQFLQGLGGQGFQQQLAAAQQQQAMGQGLAGLGFQTGQALQGLGAQQAQLGQSTAAQQAALAQAGYGMDASTAQAMAGLGQGAQAAGLQGAQAMLGAGQIQQQTNQAGIQALYNQFLQQQGYPFQVAQFLANIAMGTGALSGSTTTTTQPAPFFSDRKLKENIRKIGETKDGLPIYKFRYKGEEKDQTHIGYMADEVEKKHPDAVGEYGGAKYVDYAKVNERESMGGAVHDGGLGRAAYALGGNSPIDPNDLQALISQQRQMFSPHGAGGLYGGSAQGMPMGGKSVVPQSNLHVPKLMVAGNAPRAPQPGLGQGMDAYKTVKGLTSDVREMGTALSKAKDYIGEKLGSSPAGASEPANPAIADKFSDEYKEELAKKLMSRGGYAGGGMPYGSDDDTPYSGEEEDRAKAAAPKDILGDVVAAGKQQVNTLPKPGEPPKPPESGLGAAAKTVGQLGSMAKHGSNAVSGLGSLLGGGEAAAGAVLDPLTKVPLLGEAAAGLGTAAEGAGLLGSLGTAAGTVGEALMAFLPFLSDERTKENKRVVGELFNGEKVIAYNHPGMPTQIGLGAQHVEKRDPYSVWEDDHGLKYVDYNRATRYSGGLVPRQGFAGGGPEGMSDEEYAIRTAAAEMSRSADPQEALGIMSTIHNRRQSGQYGDTYRDVVLAPKQFEPWATTNNNPMNIKAEDPRYAAAQQAYAQIQKEGVPEEFKDVHNFWGPASQKALGREAPSWGRVGGRDYGGTRFHTLAEVEQSRGTPREGGIGAARQQVAAAQAQPQQQQEGGLGKAASGLGDLLTSSRFWAPVGTGLLTMASSPSRYGWAAALQGLGAGLAAMQPAEERAQKIEQQRLQNVGTGLGLISKSIIPINGIPHIVVPGRSGPVSYTDWVKMGRPMPVGGTAAANQFEDAGKQWLQSSGGAGAGAAGAPAGAAAAPGKVDIGAPEVPGVETPKGQTEKPIQFGMTSSIVVPKPALVSSEQEETNLLNMTPEARARQEQLNQAIINQSVAKRNEAFAMTDNLNNLAVPLASMSAGQRITPGALADMQAFVTKYFDAVVDRAGLPPEYRLGGQGLSDYEMAQKAAALLRETKVQALGQQALGALEAVSKGIADPRMTAGAARGILATAIMEKQKAAEEALFTQKYSEGRAVPVGQNASTEFRKYYKDEMYNKQAEAIKDLLSQNINGVPLIAYLLPKGEGKDPALKDRITPDVINKKYGFDISRYFLNTAN